jgi:hypothetical protein
VVARLLPIPVHLVPGAGGSMEQRSRWRRISVSCASVYRVEIRRYLEVRERLSCATTLLSAKSLRACWRMIPSRKFRPRTTRRPGLGSRPLFGSLMGSSLEAAILSARSCASSEPPWRRRVREALNPRVQPLVHILLLLHLVQSIFSRKVYASILLHCWEKSPAN